MKPTFFHKILYRVFRNQCGIDWHPSVGRQVNVEHSHALNVGDTLGPVIVEWMLAQRGIPADKTVDKTKHLLTVGSVLGRGLCDMTVWGSGILREKNVENIRRHRKLYGLKYDIRAVRGPVTKELMTGCGYACPEVYGDPAVLLPLIYTPSPEKQEKKYPVSLIAHHRTAVGSGEPSDEKNYRLNDPEERSPLELHVIDPKTTDYRAFVDELLASERVISSSLHGIILAEAYGIPTVFLNWGVSDQPYKYKDWYLSTGREMQYAASLQEALDAEPMPLPELDEMRENLLRTFPYDLWER